ncbi:uncharacterized protein VP01_10166g1, partial [Puccinia sorghi]
KVAFAVSFMTEYVATWSQPYLMRVFNTEGWSLTNSWMTSGVVSFTKITNTMLNLPCNPSAKPEQCWPICRSSTHMLALNIEFTSLWTMRAMVLKAGQTIEGIRNSRPTSPPASSSSPTTNPNAMDLSAFQGGGPHNRLSDSKRDRQLQLKLCFRCGQAGHVSHGCSNGNRKSQGLQQSLSSAQISELQAKINRIHTNPSSTNPAPNPEN